MIADCPKCRKGTRRTSLGGTTTLLGWNQQYDENGNALLNCDPNTYKSAWRCEECGTVYRVISRYRTILKVEIAD